MLPTNTYSEPWKKQKIMISTKTKFVRIRKIFFAGFVTTTVSHFDELWRMSCCIIGRQATWKALVCDAVCHFSSATIFVATFLSFFSLHIQHKAKRFEVHWKTQRIKCRFFFYLFFKDHIQLLLSASAHTLLSFCANVIPLHFFHSFLLSGWLDAVIVAAIASQECEKMPTVLHCVALYVRRQRQKRNGDKVKWTWNGGTSRALFNAEAFSSSVSRTWKFLTE